MQNAVGHAVQQIPIVTDQEQAVRIACEKTFEPNRRLEVEMVRRLIKEQKIGGTEQACGKSDAHAPSAGEGLQRPILSIFVKAEARKNARDTSRRGVGVDIV